MRSVPHASPACRNTRLPNSIYRLGYSSLPDGYPRDRDAGNHSSGEQKGFVSPAWSWFPLLGPQEKILTSPGYGETRCSFTKTLSCCLSLSSSPYNQLPLGNSLSLTRAVLCLPLPTGQLMSRGNSFYSPKYPSVEEIL